jgi:hypothetical protein
MNGAISAAFKADIDAHADINRIKAAFKQIRHNPKPFIEVYLCDRIRNIGLEWSARRAMHDGKCMHGPRPIGLFPFQRRVVAAHADSPWIKLNMAAGAAALVSQESICTSLPERFCLESGSWHRFHYNLPSTREQ